MADGKFGRRETMAVGIAAMALAGTPAFGAKEGLMKAAEKPTYGLVGQMKARPGKRDELLAILTQGARAMPGNFAYIIGADMTDPDSIWITELWLTKAFHDASLQIPSVKAAIEKARPLIAGFGTRAEFLPG